MLYSQCEIKSDFDSNDSIKDPDCTREESLPSCGQNDLNETKWIPNFVR